MSQEIKPVLMHKPVSVSRPVPSSRQLPGHSLSQDRLSGYMALAEGRGQREGFSSLGPPPDQFLWIPEPRPTKALLRPLPLAPESLSSLRRNYPVPFLKAHAEVTRETDTESQPRDSWIFTGQGQGAARPSQVWEPEDQGPHRPGSPHSRFRWEDRVETLRESLRMQFRKHPRETAP